MNDIEYTGVLNPDGTHSDDYPFCSDMPCPCHEDRAEIENVAQYIEDGEMTASEADQLYHGKTV
jgi:hypothetical protein